MKTVVMMIVCLVSFTARAEMPTSPYEDCSGVAYIAGRIMDTRIIGRRSKAEMRVSFEDNPTLLYVLNQAFAEKDISDRIRASRRFARRMKMECIGED